MLIKEVLTLVVFQRAVISTSFFRDVFGSEMCLSVTDA